MCASVASAPNAHVEFFPDDQVLNFRQADQPSVGSTGMRRLLLPQTPGLGFEFDEKAVAKYALNQAQPWTGIK